MAEEELIAPVIVDESIIPNPDTSSNSPGSFDFGVDALVDDVSLSISSTTDFLSNPLGVNTDGAGEANFLALTGAVLGPEAALLGGISLNLAKAFQDKGVSALFDSSGTTVEKGNTPEQSPRTNILHDYASMTYRITLGAQDVKDYSIIAGKDYKEGRPKMTEVLMSSGGVDNNEITRSELFKEDFYIEDLRIDTIIGQNSFTQGSNSVNIEFAIHEPYAVSLIERLIALGKKLGFDNYLEIPFVLRLDFIGYDSENNQAELIPETTKYIPIKLIHIKFKVGPKGTAYSVKAMPYNHMSLNQSVATTPSNIQVSTTTVGEFFNQKKTGSDNGMKLGLVDVINEWNHKLTEGTRNKPADRLHADEVAIVIAPDIADKKIQTTNMSKVTEKKKGDTAASTGAGRGAPVQNVTESFHHFNTGTSILAIIQSVIKNSDFYLSQLKKADAKKAKAKAENNTEDETKADDPLINFRITSSYELLEDKYDPYVNRHAYRVTYYVNPYSIHGQGDTIISPRDDVIMDSCRSAALPLSTCSLPPLAPCIAF